LKTPATSIVPHIRLLQDSRVPVQQQLFEGLRRIILRGRLRPGVPLPASRSLARALGVSRNTVLFAYEELAASGLVSGRVGSATRVVSSAVTRSTVDADGNVVEIA